MAKEPETPAAVPEAPAAPLTSREMIEQLCGGNVVAGEFIVPQAGGPIIAAVWKDGEVLLTEDGRALVERIRAAEKAAAVAEAKG